MVCVCGLVFAEQAAKPGVVGLKRERKPSRDPKISARGNFGEIAEESASSFLAGLFERFGGCSLVGTRHRSRSEP